MNTWAIILAAGRGSRLAGHHNAAAKQFIFFDGAPLFWHSALTFSHLAGISGIVFVLPPSLDPEQAEEMIRDLDQGGGLGLPWKIAAGGDERQDSVASGLLALPAACEAVLVHDSARPFASAALLKRILDGLKAGNAAVIPGIAVTDTIKSIDEAGLVRATHERAQLRAIQTPQGFLLDPLRTAYAMAARQGGQATDDATLVERLGLPVLVIEGEDGNRKITTPNDLPLLDRPVRQKIRSAINPHAGSGVGKDCEDVPCAAFGYDVHRYGGDRPFVLGGVPIACNVLVAAHSDGDTLLHALIDALLGCVGKGDIGTLFPDDNPAYDNMASGIMLAEALETATRAGLVINHVDVTIIAQIPRIAPHREAIAANLAKLLALPRCAVNVKATTEEGLGFTGEKKGIKVVALVSGTRPRTIW